jgi:hypothetical protein
MSFNRFANRRNFNQFNPVSFEEYAAVPLATQQAHDNTLNTAIESQLDVDALAPDVELRDELQGGINQRLGYVVDDIQEKGFSNAISNDLIGIKRERDKLMSSSGQLGQIQASVAARNAYREQLDKNKNITGDIRRNALALSDSRYKGVEVGGIYSGYNPSDYVDLNKEVNAYISQMKPQIIARDTGWVYNSKDNTWNKGTTKTEQLPPELIARATKQLMETNPRFQESIAQDYLFDRFNNPEKYGNISDQEGLQSYTNNQIAGISNTMGSIHQVDNSLRSNDMKVGPSGSGKGAALPSGIYLTSNSTWTLPTSNEQNNPLDAKVPERMFYRTGENGQPISDFNDGSSFLNYIDSNPNAKLEMARSYVKAIDAKSFDEMSDEQVLSEFDKALKDEESVNKYFDYVQQYDGFTEEFTKIASHFFSGASEHRAFRAVDTALRDMYNVEDISDSDKEELMKMYKSGLDAAHAEYNKAHPNNQLNYAQWANEMEHINDPDKASERLREVRISNVSPPRNVAKSAVNPALLSSKQIVIQKGSESIELNKSKEENVSVIEKYWKPEDVASVDVSPISTPHDPSYAGGSLYSITLDNGDIVRVMTQPDRTDNTYAHTARYLTYDNDKFINNVSVDDVPLLPITLPDGSMRTDENGEVEAYKFVPHGDGKDVRYYAHFEDGAPALRADGTQYWLPWDQLNTQILEPLGNLQSFRKAFGANEVAKGLSKNESFQK